jgi:hypothetical protein
MAEKEDDDAIFEALEQSVNTQQLLQYWQLRFLGHPADKEIQALEREVYGMNQNSGGLGQRDVDELQLLLAVADGVHSAFAIKAAIYNLQYTKVIILPDKNHARPHFHIHYKSEHAASYSIDNFEILAGKMPKQYERPILDWASRNQKSLKLTWDEVKAGKDVRALVLHVDAA